MSKTKLYIVSNSEDGKQNIDGVYVLVDEKGKCLYSHWCSSKCYAKEDLIERRPERIEEYKKEYGEYEVLYLGEDDMTLEKLVELTNKNYPPEEGTK